VNMPGFTAELSLGGAVLSFRGQWTRQGPTDTVQAAIHCDPLCLDNCIMDCSDCDDLPTPAARGRCIRFCAAHNIGCRRKCCH
jgi:hypothetical protein